MLSRVAENIYWLARYIERAEDTARLLSVNSHLLLDLPRPTKLGWSEIIAITGNDELFDELYETRDEANVLSFMCGDVRYSGSILSSLAAARENLRTTREIIPREIWEEINQLYLNVKEQVEAGITPRRRDACAWCRPGATEPAPRVPGRRIERALDGMSPRRGGEGGLSGMGGPCACARAHGCARTASTQPPDLSRALQVSLDLSLCVCGGAGGTHLVCASERERERAGDGERG